MDRLQNDFQWFNYNICQNCRGLEILRICDENRMECSKGNAIICVFNFSS